MMKPIKFMCKQISNISEVTIFYEDGSKKKISMELNCEDYGFEEGRHYSISDMFGSLPNDEKESKEDE